MGFKFKLKIGLTTTQTKINQMLVVTNESYPQISVKLIVLDTTYQS